MTATSVDSTNLPPTPEVQVVSFPVTGGTLFATVVTDGVGKTVGVASSFTSNAGSVAILTQGTPTALTTSATLTAAQLLTGILTANQGAAGAAAYQLPLATDLQAALPTSFGVNNAFDFSVINISVTGAEAASITTNTGWTLVGDMDIIANSASTTKSAGRFRVRETAANTFTLYRLS